MHLIEICHKYGLILTITHHSLFDVIFCLAIGNTLLFQLNVASIHSNSSDIMNPLSNSGDSCINARIIVLAASIAPANHAIQSTSTVDGIFAR